jgi:hypothetical protein
MPNVFIWIYSGGGGATFMKHFKGGRTLYKSGNLCSRPGVQGVVTRNTIASPTQVILTFSWYTLFPQTRRWRPSHGGITVSSGMEEMPSKNTPVQRLKVATQPLDVPCSGLVTHSGDTSITDKSHTKEGHWRDFWTRETGTGPQMAQLLDRYMMKMF